MGFLKGFGTFVLGLLLFVALTVFSVAFLLQSTLLSPDFVKRQVDRIDVSAVVRDVAGGQISDALPSELGFLEDAIYHVIDAQEPWLKGQADRAIDAGYAYFLGKTDTLSISVPLADLKAALKDSVWQELNKEIIVKASGDIQAELKPFIEQNLPVFRQLLPQEYRSLPDAQLEPYIYAFLQDVQDQLVKTGQVPELAGLLETLVKPAFDDYYNEFAAQIPDTFVFSENDIPADVMQQLELARQSIGYFRSAYPWLIVLMIVLAAGIFLIHRNIQDPSRALGIDLTVYGALDLAGTLVARTYWPTAYQMDIPTSLHTWLSWVYRDITGIMLWFSIGVLVVGAALIVVSFVFRKKAAEAKVEGVP